MQLVICHSQLTTCTYQWHFIHESVVNLAVAPPCQQQASLKDPDCIPMFVYQIPWRAAILPHSSRVQVGKVCIWEAENKPLLRTCPSMNQLWLYHPMHGLWSWHFPPERRWPFASSPAQHLLLQDFLSGKRWVSNALMSKIRHFSWRKTRHMRDIKHYHMLRRHF